MKDVYFVDLDYEINQYNPFDNNKLFNNEWVILKIVDDPNVNILVGKGKSNVYEVSISKYCEGWQYRIIDFINYHLNNNYKIVCSINKKDLNHAKEIYNNTNPYQLRYYEPKVLIHSTLPGYVDMIKESGCLKSWNRLKNDSTINDEQPIGRLLGDPKHYSDYIMLGEGISCEIVVLSKQLNRIEMNIDLEYEPGGRFYFDATRLASDDLLVRDGIHYKVKDELPIDHYLLSLITPKDIQFNNKAITPRSFTELSDRLFKKNFNGL
ncbi:hypothetical protein [Haloplasma contractile]|uniref:Uncharacterized protein n=1 Tax=Haloplasma contractile SSD-17B TaxID=1033810 RepID=U2FDF9_9MOLU|nr:hypothetical protein [Haloplasma contractile]ERJ11010.1 hypothetical protein HLPCO_002963 [Haloplasma contractile SSD-17B]